jgi:hypothetical protein
VERNIYEESLLDGKATGKKNNKEKQITQNMKLFFIMCFSFAVMERRTDQSLLPWKG